MKPRAGFTLIEVLVVMAIISVLAAILFPVFSRARGKAVQTTCLANLQQIGLAFAMYASDYDHILPGYDNRSHPTFDTSPLGMVYDNVGEGANVSDSVPSTPALGTLWPYIQNEQILVCPADPTPRRKLSYTCNGLIIGGGGGPVHYAEADLVSPSSKILVIDQCSVTDIVFVWSAGGAYYQSNLVVRVPWTVGTGSANWGGGLAESANLVHNSGLNCLYCDGHVKWLSEGAWPAAPTAANFLAWFAPGAE
jgi:prepilin-type N-terminal cleavage/methylation domain-containing protein/prepilin-type processing-associated H-X9-DG protein